MNEGKVTSLTFNTRYKPGYTGVLVGQCIQLPFIIVEAKTVKELAEKISHEMYVYFNTFPEEGKRILEQYGKVVETEEEKQQTSKDTEQGWDGIKIKVPIPVSR